MSAPWSSASRAPRSPTCRTTTVSCPSSVVSTGRAGLVFTHAGAIAAAAIWVSRAATAAAGSLAPTESGGPAKATAIGPAGAVTGAHAADWPAGTGPGGGAGMYDFPQAAVPATPTKPPIRPNRQTQSMSPGVSGAGEVRRTPDLAPSRPPCPWSVAPPVGYTPTAEAGITPRLGLHDQSERFRLAYLCWRSCCLREPVAPFPA